MALKFLNKKGWHTGSLRNIENVWKAEQKHEAEQRKLEELRKQIQEERERDEFRLLQERAGLTPRQERLEFLYDSGLAVGKTSSEGFKALEAYPSEKPTSASASGSAPSSSQSAAPGALFEEKPQSANDAWRKLHSDPLLMIRQREQEALARIKNNPVKMALIRKSMETKKKDDETQDGECKRVKSKYKKHSSSKHPSDSEDDSHDGEEKRKKPKHKEKEHLDSDDDSRDRTRHHRHSHRDYESEQRQHSSRSKRKADRNEEDSRERSRHHGHDRWDCEGEKKRHGSPSRQRGDRREDIEGSKRGHERSKHEGHSAERENGSIRQASDSNHSTLPPRPESHKRRGRAPQLSEEERTARLREMQVDAELHEEQRWKRLKKAEEDDAREARRLGGSGGKSFLDAVQKSVYGAEKGGSSTIEESVRRRTHFLQGRTEADERNAFRR